MLLGLSKSAQNWVLLYGNDIHMTGSKWIRLIGPIRLRSQLWPESDLKRFMSVKLQFWALMIAHCTNTSSDGWGIHSLSGLHARTTKATGPFYLHLSWACIATQGGAVSQLFCLFAPFLVDGKQRSYFFLFCFGKASAKTSFKELPMTVWVPLVLEAYFCGCRSLCC